MVLYEVKVFRYKEFRCYTYIVAVFPWFPTDPGVYIIPIDPGIEVITFPMSNLSLDQVAILWQSGYCVLLVDHGTVGLIDSMVTSPPRLKLE